MAELDAKLADALETISPKSPRDVAYSDLCRNASYLHRRISGWDKQAKSLIENEVDRISKLASDRNKIFHEKMMPVVEDVDSGRVKLNAALKLMEREKERQDQENEELFEPYIEALECLQESIDLQGLVSFGAEEVSDLREEVNRLNELAQLGITVEIVGHELASYDSTIGGGLNDLPDEIKNSRAYERIKVGYESLTERLRFLAPMKISGERSQEWISGLEIEEFITKFFREDFSDKNIGFSISKSFGDFRVYDLPARIFPVFINLVNNSLYWVGQQDDERKITIDLIDQKVVISDTGPGVEEGDIKSLFTLFFTRKIRGGRGVGLYLCRTNLAASGHRIEYAVDEKDQLLPGANFVLSFKGAEYGS